MPDKSVFTQSIGLLPSAGWKSQLPEGYGSLEITRIDIGRVFMFYIPRNGGCLYIGTFTSEASPNLGYWYKYTGTRID